MIRHCKVRVGDTSAVGYPEETHLTINAFCGTNGEKDAFTMEIICGEILTGRYITVQKTAESDGWKWEMVEISIVAKEI